MNNSFKRLLKPTGHVLSTAVLTSAAIDALFTHPSHAKPSDSTPHTDALTNSLSPVQHSADVEAIVPPETSVASSDYSAEQSTHSAPRSALSQATDLIDNNSDQTNLETHSTGDRPTAYSQNSSSIPLSLEPLTEDLEIDFSQDEAPSEQSDTSQVLPERTTTPVDENPSTTWNDALEASRQRLEAKLSRIVQQERDDREAEFRQNLLAIATRQVQAGNLPMARQIARNPVLTNVEREQLLSLIDNASSEPVLTPSETTAPQTVSRPNSQSLPGNAPRLGWEIANQQRWQRFSGRSSNPLCQRFESRRVDSPVQNMHRATRQHSPLLREIASAPIGQANRASDWNARQRPCIERSPSIADVPTSFFTSDWFPDPRYPGQFQMIFPLAIPAPITSTFGWRIHPIFGGRRFHYGLDLGAPAGTPVLAAIPGYVETSSYLDGYGLTVVIENQDAKQRNLYAHLSEIAVAPGTWVEQGTVIGWVGSTGNSTGPHLHFEVHQLSEEGWIAVDPMVVSPNVRLGAR